MKPVGLGANLTLTTLSLPYRYVDAVLNCRRICLRNKSENIFMDCAILFLIYCSPNPIYIQYTYSALLTSQHGDDRPNNDHDVASMDPDFFSKEGGGGDLRNDPLSVIL